MRYLRIALLLILVAMLFPAALLAQEDTPTDSIDLVEALAIVQETYGEEIIILAATYDADNACWQFEFADDTAVCVDETTGEILLDEGTDNGAVDDTEDAQETPAVSVEDAIAAALPLFPDSAISSISFEVLEDGSFAWDIGLDDDVLSVDVDAMTGEVLLSGDETNDNVGTPVNNVDDGAIDNVDDGAVDDVDDGTVDDTDAAAVGDTDDGEVGNQDESNQGNEDQADQGDQGE